MDYVSAPYCGVCGVPLEVSPKEITTCGPCLAAPPPFKSTRAVFVYNAPSRRLILRFKDYGATYLGKLFAAWMYQRAQDTLKEADILVPVPLHWKKLIKRGYNQSVLLVKALSRLSDKPFSLTVLAKTKGTPSQGRLSARIRLENIKGAYAVTNARLLKDKKIVLVDDVMSSGATIKECAQILLKNGAKQVDVIVIARAKLRRIGGWTRSRSQR